MKNRRNHKKVTLTDREIVCWIVTSSDFRVRKVVASYDSKNLRWNYHIRLKNGGLMSWSGLSPYCPTFGNGKMSYSGDGPRFKTKKEAMAEQLKVLKTQEKLLRQKHKKELQEFKKMYPSTKP